MINSLSTKSLPISLASLLILSLQATSTQAARIYNKTHYDEIKVVGQSAIIFAKMPEITIARGARSGSLDWAWPDILLVGGSIEPTLYSEFSKEERRIIDNWNFCEKDRKKLDFPIKIPAPNREEMHVCWAPLMTCGSPQKQMPQKMVGGNYAVVSRPNASSPYEFITKSADAGKLAFSCTGNNQWTFIQ